MDGKLVCLHVFRFQAVYIAVLLILNYDITKK